MEATSGDRAVQSFFRLEPVIRNYRVATTNAGPLFFVNGFCTAKYEMLPKRTIPYNGVARFAQGQGETV
jgi:hypothetical protein